MLNGNLIIVLPEGLGLRKCKGVRVRFRTEIILDLGSGRMRERDVLFERLVEVGRDGEEIVLKEGFQRYALSFRHVGDDRNAGAALTLPSFYRRI